MFYKITWGSSHVAFSTHDDNLRIHFNPISQFPPNFTISTKFHNFHQISQSQKIQNFNQISQHSPNFTIPTKFHNFHKIAQFWSIQKNADNTDNEENASNADITDNADNADNTDNAYSADNISDWLTIKADFQ